MCSDVSFLSMPCSSLAVMCLVIVPGPQHKSKTFVVLMLAKRPNSRAKGNGVTGALVGYFGLGWPYPLAWYFRKNSSYSAWLIVWRNANTANVALGGFCSL